MKIFRGYREIIKDTNQENTFHTNPRQPRDTSQEIHNIADTWFFKKFGVHARSSALICTTDMSQASGYGYCYEIIPQKPYEIIYSPKVRDFLEHEHEVEKESPISIIEWLSKMNFKATQSISEIDPNFFGEVMVSCKYYKAIPLLKPNSTD